MTKFFAKGTPVAQGSKNAYLRGGKVALVESSKTLPKWRKTVTQAAKQAHEGEPVDGPVEISLEFAMPRPKAWGKKRQDPMIQRPDTDKLIRAVFDAITGVVVHDDSQFTRVKAFKRRAAHGEPTGVFVELHHENAGHVV